MMAKRSKRQHEKAVLRITDEELEKLRARVAKRREYVAVLEVELFNTRADLEQFTLKYNSRVGPLEQRLNRLKDLLEQKLEEEYEYPGRDDEPEPEPHPERGQGANGHGGAFFVADEETTERDPELEQQLKSLFRELAKQYHPDLVTDPEEKAWREDIMAQVNQAYTARDLEALQKLAEQPAHFADDSPQTRNEEFASLQQEMEHLESLIVDIEKTLRQIDISPAMQLKREVKRARRTGRNMLEDMAAEMRQRIQDLEEQLLALGVEVDLTAAS